jgi:hypothetical protein
MIEFIEASNDPVLPDRSNEYTISEFIALLAQVVKSSENPQAEFYKVYDELKKQCGLVYEK